MSTLRFSDGVVINTAGEIRVLRLDDGPYVVGEGYLIPVKDDAEASATMLFLHRKQLNHYTHLPEPHDPLARQSRKERINYHKSKITSLLRSKKQKP